LSKITTSGWKRLQDFRFDSAMEGEGGSGCCKEGKDRWRALEGGKLLTTWQLGLVIGVRRPAAKVLADSRSLVIVL